LILLCDVFTVMLHQYKSTLGHVRVTCSNYFVVLCDFIHRLHHLFSSSLLNTTQLGIQSTGCLLICFKIWYFCVPPYFSDHPYKTSSGMDYFEVWGKKRSVHVIFYKSMDTRKNNQELAEQ